MVHAVHALPELSGLYVSEGQATQEGLLWPPQVPCNCWPVGQVVVQSAHWRFDVDVAATVSYCVEVQAVRDAHCVLVVLEQAWVW